MRVPTEDRIVTKKEIVPLYAESINMMEGLEDSEIEQYLDENAIEIIPLFEINAVEIITPYVNKADFGSDDLEIITPYVNKANFGSDDQEHQPDPKTLIKLRKQQEGMERENANISAVEIFNPGRTKFGRQRQ